MNPIDKVLQALDQHGKQPFKRGKGWRALCPAHDDHHPSLDITETPTGKVLLKCWSHDCNVKQITAAIGLSVGDLFCTPSSSQGHSKKQTRRTRSQKPKGDTDEPMQTFSTPEDAFEHLFKQHGRTRYPIWEYHNNASEIVAYIIRFDPKEEPKFFLPISRRGESWVVKAPLGPRPLYNLPQVLASKSQILMPEGEKCADIAKQLGFVGTTTMGGADAARQSDLRPLEGREVWILPDNNKPGRRYAETLLKQFGKLKIRPKIKVLELPGLLEGEDIEQFRDRYRQQGMSDEEIGQLILKLGEEPPFYEWPPQQESRTDTVCQAISDGKTSPKIGVLNTVRASQIKLEPIEWFWEDYIPFGCITVLVGLPKMGKSQVACNLAAIASRGGLFPNGTISPKCEVLYCSVEDDAATVLAPRLVANQANLNAIHFPTGVTTRKNRDESKTQTQANEDDPNDTEEEYWNLLHLPALENCLNEKKDIRLIVIDPMGSYVGGTTEVSVDNKIRDVLIPLHNLAQERKIAVLLVCHVGKSKRENADQNILGGTGIHAVARASFHVQPNKEEPETRLFVPGKGNLSKAPPGWKIWFEDFKLPNEEGKVIKTSRVCWSEEPIEGVEADDHYQEQGNEFGRRGPKAIKLDEAKDWLVALLKDGEKSAVEVYEKASSVGIPKSTLNRAKTVLKIDPKKKGTSWYWSLPLTHEKPEYLEHLEQTNLENPTDLEDTQEGENLSISEDTQVSPVSESCCLPNCQEEQATETDDASRPLVARNLFEEYLDQCLPD